MLVARLPARRVERLDLPREQALEDVVDHRRDPDREEARDDEPQLDPGDRELDAVGTDQRPEDGELYAGIFVQVGTWIGRLVAFATRPRTLDISWYITVSALSIYASVNSGLLHRVIIWLNDTPSLPEGALDLLDLIGRPQSIREIRSCGAD